MIEWKRSGDGWTWRHYRVAPHSYSADGIRYTIYEGIVAQRGPSGRVRTWATCLAARRACEKQWAALTGSASGAS